MVYTSPHPFNLTIKPAGPSCNLACDYCYYLDKAALYPGQRTRMDHDTLERVTAAYLLTHPGPEVAFLWQGGEPLLMGRDFFASALKFQARYARPDQRVVNTLQTNGTFVNDAWAAFFAEHHFLVGISMDGPAELHDHYRRDRGGRPTHARALAGLHALQRNGAQFNVLATVNRVNVQHPLRVYRYLTGLGVQHLQFIPIVERQSSASRKVAPWTVPPEQYGAFLCAIFDYWVRHDVGRVFVQIFESALNVWLGGLPSVCVFAPTCGRSLVVEHNGDLYSCDHFVYAEYLLGNVAPEALGALVDGPQQHAFGAAKGDLPAECLSCSVLPFCGGDCPKNRLMPAGDGNFISYLCTAHRRFFCHSAEVLQAIASQIRLGRPALSAFHAPQKRKPPGQRQPCAPSSLAR